MAGRVGRGAIRLPVGQLPSQPASTSMLCDMYKHRNSATESDHSPCVLCNRSLVDRWSGGTFSTGGVGATFPA